MWLQRMMNFEFERARITLSMAWDGDECGNHGQFGKADNLLWGRIEFFKFSVTNKLCSQFK
jgi:hypothetical protein